MTRSGTKTFGHGSNGHPCCLSATNYAHVQCCKFNQFYNTMQRIQIDHHHPQSTNPSPESSSDLENPHADSKELAGQYQLNTE